MGSKRLVHAGLALVIIASFAFRAFVAPYSSGSDIPQFAGFGDTLKASGTCFYVSASTPRGEPWPYPWLYPYGPPLAVVMAVLASVLDTRPTWGWEGARYVVRVPVEWAIAAKAFFIAGDAAATVLVYSLARRRGATQTVALALAAAYAASPATVYLSAIYGMFDQVAVAMLLAALYTEKPSVRGALAALAALTKPTLLLPAVAVILWGRNRAKTLAYAAAAVAFVTAPFVLLCPDTMKAVEAVLEWRGSPRPPLPSVYSFSWLGSVVAYYYERGVDYTWLLKAWPLTAVALAPLALKAAGGDEARAALAAYTWLLAFSWSVNYQFLIPLVALILALYPTLQCRLARAAAALLWAHISLWPVLFPSEFWFKVHTEGINTLAGRVVSQLTLDKMYGGEPSLAYSLILGVLEVTLLASLAACPRRRGWEG